jgi:phytoene dehydrogenase-like protein
VGVKRRPRKIVIIGAGIAGLCAAVYARKSGYDVDVIEMNDRAGGLATDWSRGDYTFENALEWLVGSRRGPVHEGWREVFDVDRLRYVHLEEFDRVQDSRGESLPIFTDVDRLEATLLERAPQDAEAIGRFVSAVRKLGRFELPDPTKPRLRRWLSWILNAPYLPLVVSLGRTSIEEYGRQFTHPLLRAFFADGGMGKLSMAAVVFSLAWMNDRNAEYPIGGSQAVIGGIVEALGALGGRIRFGIKVERILVERNAAIGVQLAGGELILADWVISAADAHATVYELLGGGYKDALTERTFSLETFPSYLEVSMGVKRDLSRQPACLTCLLDEKLTLDPGTQLSHVRFRFFHFDPTFAPPGKTAVTCFLPTYGYEYWVALQRDDPMRYETEKQRIADAVISVLERNEPGVRDAIEVVDVATPATVIRYTGNWKGSMEGWLLTPRTGYGPLRNTLPGLRRFFMVGQWVSPGGGLPSGVITARTAIAQIARLDRVPFCGAASVSV